MPDINKLQSEAVTAALDNEGGGIVTGIITIAEMVLNDGEHYLLTLSDSDLSTWRKMGMLHGAMEDEKARHSADILAARINAEDD